MSPTPDAEIIFRLLKLEGTMPFEEAVKLVAKEAGHLPGYVQNLWERNVTILKLLGQ